MAGVIIETLSTKKLMIFITCLLLLQVGAFLVGSLIEAKPAHVMTILGTKCWGNKSSSKTDLIYTRKTANPKPDGNCQQISSRDDEIVKEDQHIGQNVVFVFQMPLPKQSIMLRMSRWFQYMVAVLHIDNEFNSQFPYDKSSKLTVHAKLAYRDFTDAPDKWTMMVESLEERDLKCQKDDKSFDCDILPLFEIGSVHHSYYVLNLQLPYEISHAINGTNTLTNTKIGKLNDIYLNIIMQTGGFTKIWLSMKTIISPFVFALLIFFKMRVSQQNRKPSLLEKIIFGMGLAMLLLDLPIEWLTLSFKIPFMLLLSDIRQGIFYCALLSFWVVFCGEHVMDNRYKLYKNRLVIYWKELTAIGIGSACLFLFDICERGIQLNNPFFTIWASKSGSNVAFGFIVLASIAACVYFLFLLFIVLRVMKNIWAKKSSLPGMNIKKQKYYKKLIYRFYFLISSTIVFSALTAITFIISQFKDGNWKWGSGSWHPNDDTSEEEDDIPVESHPLQYTSGFFTGIFFMWNAYVGSLLFLYAPSKKIVDLSTPCDENSDISDEENEEIEFSNLPSEASALNARSQNSENHISFIASATKENID